MATALDIRDLELSALLEVTQAINNNLPETDLYKIYKFTLLADLKIARLALFVHDEDWKCKVHFGVNGDWTNAILREQYRRLTDDHQLEDGDPESEDFEFVFPVTHKKKLLAVVFVGGVSKKDYSGNTTFLKALTNIILVAVENKKLARQQLEQEAYRKELEIAKRVQNFLFPKRLPASNRLKMEAVYLPHHDVGGDYYDYLKIDNDRFLFCIADVSGKGVPAALLMSNFQASLRILVRQTRHLREIVEELNLATYKSGNAENFITFFIAIYDFKSKSFEYVNCGHNPLFLMNGHKIDMLEKGTTVLGMFNPLPFLETHCIPSIKEFYFFGYTDGLTESTNPQEEQFGAERLISLLMNSNGYPIKDIHNRILTELKDFCQGKPYRDDITMLSCRVTSL